MRSCAMRNGNVWQLGFIDNADHQANELLMRHYFCTSDNPPQYNEATFWRRYTVTRAIFNNTLQKVTAADPYFQMVSEYASAQCAKMYQTDWFGVFSKKGLHSAGRADRPSKAYGCFPCSCNGCFPQLNRRVHPNRGVDRPTLPSVFLRRHGQSLWS